MKSRLHRCLAFLMCSTLSICMSAQADTFVSRQQSSDLRLLTYNTFWDRIFPDFPTEAAAFQRIVSATQPDIINLQEINRSPADVATLLNDISPLANGASWNAVQGRDNVIASPFPILEPRTNTLPSSPRDLAIGRVDLPDEQYARDFYIMNNHYQCCSGGDGIRQLQSDALVNWMRDARSVGGQIDLPGHTAMAVLGDLNIVGSLQPLQTVIDGNIQNESIYGFDSHPDWDGSNLLDAHPRHNVTGTEDYTWRDDGQVFDPGRLDYVIFTDSVLELAHSYVLNTRDMTPSELAQTGLMADDVLLNASGNNFDHLPLVTDFRMDTLADIGDLSGNGSLDATDLIELQSNVVGGTIDLKYDMNADRVPDSDDVTYWVTDMFETLPGDANLDGLVDGADFTLWSKNKFRAATWLSGDFNSDGFADGADFLIWNQFKFLSANVVPESNVRIPFLLGIGLLALRYRRGR